LTFATVARRLNLSHASAELHASQSSITQKLKTLEKEFKTKLYQKAKRGVVLTENGELFLGHVQAVLKDIAKLNEDFGKRRPMEQKLLRVGGSYAPSATYLPQVLAAFRKRHPTVQLSLKTHDSATLERMLLRAELDVALLNHRPASVEVTSEPYRREKLVLFAHSNQPLAKARLTLRDLARAPLIIRETKGAPTLIERKLKETDSELRPNIVLRCESPGAVKAAVRSNMGIGLLFLSSVEADFQTGKFKRLRLIGADLDVHTYIVYRKQSLTPWFQILSEFYVKGRISGRRGATSV